jgi:putative ABC transport system ATP-binding protein
MLLKNATNTGSINPSVSPRVAIEATNLYRFFHTGGEETLALRGVSVSVKAGEIVAITGPSGSGKSTLLSCLAGLDEPDGGMVHVAGHELSRQPEVDRSRLRARHIGMLFQSNNLLDHLSVSSNVEVAQLLAQTKNPPSVDGLLSELGLSHRATARPSRLSGGETARAGLAVALANNPEVIVADEPTGELDSVTASLVLNLLKARAAQGAAVVLVTHSPAVAAIANREIKLRDGVVASLIGASS